MNSTFKIGVCNRNRFYGALRKKTSPHESYTLHLSVTRWDTGSTEFPTSIPSKLASLLHELILLGGERKGQLGWQEGWRQPLFGSNIHICLGNHTHKVTQIYIDTAFDLIYIVQDIYF